MRKRTSLASGVWERRCWIIRERPLLPSASPDRPSASLSSEPWNLAPWSGKAPSEFPSVGDIRPNHNLPGFPMEPGNFFISFVESEDRMKMFIDDQWVEASDNGWMNVCNPGTGEV